MHNPPIIGSAFEVYNHLGYGFLNRVYQRSLQVELRRHGFSGDLETRTTVRYKDAIVGEYDVDMIVNDGVLVEIKIAPQYDIARRSSAAECAESGRTEAWHSAEFRPVQGRV